MQSHQVSILFNDAHDAPDDGSGDEPAYLGDLRLDQIISALTAGRESYRLTAYLHRPLRSVETVRYRQQVLRDLEREPVHQVVTAFARGMARMRRHLHLAETLHHA
jgi:DNA mismatch repair protein MutS